ncbi:MAG: hypothetical protein ACLRSW_08690 [Christensenellaceae bacterium]
MKAHYFDFISSHYRKRAQAMSDFWSDMTANGKSLRVSSLPLSGNEKQRRSKRKRFYQAGRVVFSGVLLACPAPCLRLRRKGDGKEELNQNILDQIDKLIRRNCKNT